MKDLDEQRIQELVKEAREIVPDEEIYNLAIKNINVGALYDMQPVKADIIAKSFAVSGFMEGIRFVLRNLESKEVEKND